MPMFFAALCVAIAASFVPNVGAKETQTFRPASDEKVMAALLSALSRCKTAECRYMAVCGVDTPINACKCSWSLLKDGFTEQELMIYADLLETGVTRDIGRAQLLFRQLGSNAFSFRTKGDSLLESAKEKCSMR
jgi:hypothetical protein